MFDLDFSGGRILTVAGQRNDSRPGDVPYEESAHAQMLAEAAAPRQEGRVHPLDTDKAEAMHAKLLAIYRYELERQAENRYEMAVDEDFYDHIQWTIEEVATLEARGQYPLVFNLIQTSINWILGTQRRAPQDYKVLPRTKHGTHSAERKTELMTHLRDVNHSNQAVSLAFTDAVKAGVGWLETGQGDPTDGPLVFDRRESWRNMWWDSRALEMNLSDARYVTRMKWMDEDILASMFPDRVGVIELSAENKLIGGSMVSDFGDDASDSQEYDDTIGFSNAVTTSGAYLRNRIRCMEMWFRRPVPVPVLDRGQFRGEIFDEWSRGHWDELKAGNAGLTIQPRQVMHVAVFTEKGLLDFRQSPYRHNQFPFTPIWGNRRARDGMPYGAIRGMRGPQKDLNKRLSKALHHLSTVRVTVEEGAVDDIEELRDEAGRPDSVIVHKAGRQPPQIQTNTEVAASHLQLMETDARMIQDVGGVTSENLGRNSNASSGKAIIAKQEQGSLTTSIYFDNLRYACALHGEKQVVNVEQFYSEQDEIRITDARGNPQWVELNHPEQPENAIDRFKADFIIEEEDWRASTRQAQAAVLMELLNSLAATAPQIVINTLDLAIEKMDIPNREEFVKRIRQITGQTDPDEDPNNPSPESIARKQAADEQAALQKRGIEAELAEKEAKAAKTKAEAHGLLLGLRGKSLDDLTKAIAAAVQIAGAPAVGAAVDQLLATAQEDADAAAGGGQPAPMTVPDALPEPQPQPQMAPDMGAAPMPV